MKVLVSIVGPTASGKTDLAIRMARQLHCPVISADSRQIFRHMDIGTAKPTQQEMQGIRHYCIDELEPNENVSAAWFGRRVEAILGEEFGHRDVMVMAGGSGLYLHAVWHGFDEIPEVPESVREQLLTELESRGLPALVDELAEADPEVHASIDRSNPQRVVRALEVFRHTGLPMSGYRKGTSKPLPGVQHIKVGLDLPREELYERINQRVDRMIQSGLLDEARKLFEEYGEDCASLQTLGYQEWLPYLRQEIPLAAAIELIKRNSRRYAKRQLTWFRRYPDIQWFPANHPEVAKQHIENELDRLHGSKA